VDAPDPQLVGTLAGWLRDARSALFITGAGISADSGLPTYRGVGGIYEGCATDEGIPIEVALSGPMIRRCPEITWKYIHQIESACRGKRPNRAHEVIAELEPRLERCCVLTQNVDGFHRDAGSSDVIEIHGNLHHLHCTQCDWERRVHDYAELDDTLGRDAPRAPSCPVCKGLVRPRVVLFGEMLPEDAVGQLARAIETGFDLVVSIGTTSAFPYIAEPVHSARARGAATVEINPAESEVSGIVDLVIRARALPTFAALAAALSSPP
jgi:NAD-dependent deacetylase